MVWQGARVMLARLVAALVLFAAGGAECQVLRAEPVPDESVADTAVEPGFAGWLTGFRIEALAAGIRAETLDATLPGLSYSPRVVALDRAQPGDSGGSAALFSDYLARRLEPVREARGRAAKARYAAKLAEVEAATGVPSSIVLGIWGMESSYGAVTGDFDVLRSLASLAYDGRRRALFTKELIAALTIVDKGAAAPAKLRGSWAGAMGQPQFLPSSFVAYAKDGDGDGRADIWDSGEDVAASIASYLATKGWRRGEGWGLGVNVPAGLDRGRGARPRPAGRMRPRAGQAQPLDRAQGVAGARADARRRQTVARRYDAGDARRTRRAGQRGVSHVRQLPAAARL